MNSFDIKQKLYTALCYSESSEYESGSKRMLGLYAKSALGTKEYKETKTTNNVMALG